MLREWKYREGSEATYSVLYSALSDELVGRKDLAEKFCLNHWHSLWKGILDVI